MGLVQSILSFRQHFIFCFHCHSILWACFPLASYLFLPVLSSCLLLPQQYKGSVLLKFPLCFTPLNVDFAYPFLFLSCCYTCHFYATLSVGHRCASPGVLVKPLPQLTQYRLPEQATCFTVLV